ncbi:hypothetical protein EOA32_05660 [Mesorhizobium sp. M1A.F.Ca.ET.072.01.1.1]|uniref:hypothetical protein n=1 Tax=Mesorhizobium sp. M1A.F.Ca.ET.072.01.1.1 TaxID=2496753 RepID=UPI000FD34D94|nr:hypothetical protein [Mesorhizobium sp. M1A.F.Ca.ET.072.01.1.1]RUW54428.1 hypothetical protein EOA32_05660 [Mesorhizobium sp. M1A.F.Ca.ET.072.01.1.1]TIV04813.1 MAG: hypothetical protein E5W04_01695 [Mesorhizobium sp.]
MLDGTRIRVRLDRKELHIAALAIAMLATANDLDRGQEKGGKARRPGRLFSTVLSARPEFLIVDGTWLERETAALLDGVPIQDVQALNLLAHAPEHLPGEICADYITPSHERIGSRRRCSSANGGSGAARQPDLVARQGGKAVLYLAEHKVVLS